jgi:ATP-binding cassette subfamily F protein 3
VGNGDVREFLGNYSDYRWQVEEGSAQALNDTTAPGSSSSSKDAGKTSGGASSSSGSSKRNGRSSPPADDDPLAGLNSYQIKKKLEETEAEILEKEEKQEEIEAQMADPEAYGENGRARELSQTYNALKKDLASLYDRWEALTDRVMALDE